MFSKNTLLSQYNSFQKRLLYRTNFRNLFIVSLEYKVSLNKIEEHLEAHRSFLKNCYENNFFVTSGRKIPRTGGIIIASMEDKNELLKVLERDPFYKNHLAKYEITEFVPSMHCEDFSRMAKKDLDKTKNKP